MSPEKRFPSTVSGGVEEQSREELPARRRTQEEIDYILNKIKHEEKEVCIFGLGKMFTNVGKQITQILGVNVCCYSDNDEKKWDTILYDGNVCVKPSQIKYKTDICIVLVGQWYEEDISKQLYSLGVTTILTFDEICSLDWVLKAFFSRESYYNKEIIEKRKEVAQKNIEMNYKVANTNKKSIAIYTCITGDYDAEIQEPEVINSDADYYVISDTNPKEKSVWKWINAKEVIPEWIEEVYRRARFGKTMGMNIFTQYKYSIYIDGNVKIMKDPTKYVQKIGKTGIATYDHYFEDSLYTEAVRVIGGQSSDEELVRLQISEYLRDGMPIHYGEYHTAVVVRDNNSEICQKIMREWWIEIHYLTHRDQLSLPYVLWKNGYKHNDVGILAPKMRADSTFKWVSKHEH